MKKEKGKIEFQKILKKTESGEELYPLYIFTGPRPITTPLCSALSKALTGKDRSETNMERFSGDTMSEGKVVEFLMTRGLFSTGRKVAWVQDPPFLEGSDSIKARWGRLRSSFDKGEMEKVLRQAASISKDRGIDPEKFLDMPIEQITAECQMQPEIPIAPIMSLIRERRDKFLEHASKITDSSGGRLTEWLKAGHPARASVILQAENVDRRCAAFKVLSSMGPVFNFDISGTGRRRAIEAERRVKGWFAEEGVEAAPGVTELIVSLAGDKDLAFLKAETGKLISMCSHKRKITQQDVRSVITRSREEELYKLTGAISAKDLPGALESLRIILSQGIAPIVIVAAISNLVRRMTMLKAAILAGPGTERVLRASSREFEQEILPGLRNFYATPKKEDKKDKKQKRPLDGHPYAIYMATRNLHRFTMEELLDLTARMSEFDLAVKGESSSPEEFLEYVIFEIIIGRNEMLSAS